jgi:uncharacterized protein (DUF433 family)
MTSERLPVAGVLKGSVALKGGNNDVTPVCLFRRSAYVENLDWSKCPAVESIPGKVSGAWVFRHSRTPVKLVFENLEDGMTIDEIIEQYPCLPR